MLSDKALENKEEEPPLIDTKCNYRGCENKKHGLFYECKTHFMEIHSHLKNGKRFFKWGLSNNVGYITIMTILSCYPYLLNIEGITEKNIDKCYNSKIPLICLRCGYSWSPIISSLISSGSGCPDCSGKAPWTLQRLKNITFKYPLINFSKVISKDINNGTSSILPVSCNYCKKSWEASINSLINKGTGCPHCAGNAKWTLERFKEVMDIYFFLVNISKVEAIHINGSKSKVPVSCYNCDYEWNPIINSLMQGYGCPDCAGLTPWTLERFTARMSHRKEIDILKVTKEHIKNARSYVPIKCKVKCCEHEWSPSINHLISGKTGCPNCKSSKGVKTICEYLNGLNIYNTTEKTFEGMTYKGLLRVDVYIRSFSGISLPICIEFDGNYPGSHFLYRNDNEKIKHISTVRRDRIKDDFVKNNNMHMIRIPYTCFVNNNEEQLIKHLSNSLESLKNETTPQFLPCDKELYKKRDDNLNEIIKQINVYIYIYIYIYIYYYFIIVEDFHLKISYLTQYFFLSQIV